MSELTWIHLSDWHEGGRNLDRVQVRRALLQDIESRIKIDKRLASIDFIAFTGDLGYSGQAGQYEVAMQDLIEPLLAATDLGWNRLFVVPGNHDLDREALKRYVPGWLAEVKHNNSQVQEVWQDPEAIQHLLRPFKAYAEFIAKYTDLEQGAYAYVRDFVVGGTRVAVGGLNSALFSGRSVDPATHSVDDARRLVLGEIQVNELLWNKTFSTADLRIALVHHPFDWLAEFDRRLVQSRLQAESHLILRGHEHESAVISQTGTGGDCVIIPAGPSYDRREPEVSKCANSYNYVSLNMETGRCTVFLRKYEEGSGWIPDVGRTKTKTGTHGSGVHSLTSSRLKVQRPLIVEPPNLGKESTEESDLSLFTGRGDHVQAFGSLLDGETRGLRGIAVYGHGGIGKTFLLEKYQSMCKDRGIAIAKVSGVTESSVLLIAQKILQELDRQKVRLPGLVHELGLYESRRDKVRGATYSPSDSPAPRTSLHSILGGDSGAFLNPAAPILAALSQDLTRAVRWRRIALLFDSYDQMASIDEDIRRFIGGLDPAVIVVIAGRTELSGDWLTLSPVIRAVKLEDMEEDEAVECLCLHYRAYTQKMIEEEVATRLVGLAHGLPLALRVLAFCLASSGREQCVEMWHRRSEVVVAAMMTGVALSIQPMVEKCAVLRWFNEDSLRGLFEMADARSLYKAIARLPFVNSRGKDGMLMLHDLVREWLDDELRRESPSEWHALNRRAADMYNVERLRREKSDEAVMVGDASELA